MKGGLEYEYKPDPAIWWEDNASGCLNTYTLPLVLLGMKTDSNDNAKKAVEMSFSEAFNNKLLRDQVGTWRIFEEGTLQTRWFDRYTFGGVFSLQLPWDSALLQQLRCIKTIKTHSANP